jgi:dolichol-phosphate mannosyltransferase
MSSLEHTQNGQQNGLMKEKNFLSAVVYLNSAENAARAGEFLKKLSRTLDEHFLHYEIICVDDDTKEDILDEVRKLKTDNEESAVTILHMSYYQGMEMAMNAGRDLAIGDFVMEFDECRWNFPEETIMRVYRECLKDCDIVCCGDEKKNKATSRLFYRLFNRFAHIPYELESDNFRILSRRGINRVKSLNNTTPYRKALYANCGLPFKTIHYTPVQSGDYRHKKAERRDRRNLAVNALLLFTDIGYQAAAFMAVLMAAIMVLTAFYAIVIYTRGIAIVGWTTTILFLSGAFFGLFIILAIIIKYLSLLLNLNFRRQRYMFSSIEKI